MLDEKITDEGLALKDTLRKKRDSINLSNQDIADISGLPVGTVNNYFTSRSKASSAYTVGKICMALRMSFDKAFGIVPDEIPEESNADLDRIAELEQRCKDYEKDLAHQTDIIKLKDEAIRAAEEQIRRRRPIIYCLLGITALVVLAFLAYLLHFDLTNPSYGLFRR